MSNNYPTPEQQCAALWLVLKEHNNRHRSKHEKQPCVDGMPAAIAREWPSYDSVVTDMAKSDYSENLQCPHDLRFLGMTSGKTGSGGKTLCPHGVVCQAKIELFDHPASTAPKDDQYTGLLAPGRSVEHCIVRLSSAMRPPNDVVKTSIGKAVLRATGPKLRKAKLFPTFAIKTFRGNNVRSGNLLFSGCKVGQPETDYFAHCLCTQLTEKVNPALKPFVQKFWSYSDYPLSLGLSDYCAHDIDGNPPSGRIFFPYVLILKPIRKAGTSCASEPTVSAAASEEVSSATCPHHAHSNKKHGKGQTDEGGVERFDRFLEDMESIHSGTILFDLFCCPEPKAAIDPTRLQRIGRIITTSEAIPSHPDDNLFFRHQKKEEDFALRPEWERAAKMKCSVGHRKGSISKLAGWKLFEEQIERNTYVDFEKS
mmetsp:Transcript_36427/g.79690  ORF Transcript_36427/g.79690 Transcript_36427/m.79690 type:complete len:425 (-) Transcript_36427:55-1329(-)